MVKQLMYRGTENIGDLKVNNYFVQFKIYFLF